MQTKARRWLKALASYGVLAVVCATVAGLLYWQLNALASTDGVRFRTPWMLWLVVPCVLAAWLTIHRTPKRAPSFRFSRVEDLAAAPSGLVWWVSSVPSLLRVAALGLLVVALARPQTFVRDLRDVEGIDVMVVLDISDSMKEEDLGDKRLVVAQSTIRRFLKGRDDQSQSIGERDRIGLVAFAQEALLVCPLTLDYHALDELLYEVRIGDVAPKGTAVGDALGLAMAGLRRGDERSKAIVLVTDGDSNTTNYVSPGEALAIAKEREIRIFTVLMGKQGTNFNPGLLRRLGQETGGGFFPAGDATAFEEGFQEVRRELERSKFHEVHTDHRDLFPTLIYLALLLLGGEVFLSLTRFRRFP